MKWVVIAIVLVMAVVCQAEIVPVSPLDKYLQTDTNITAWAGPLDVARGDTRGYQLAVMNNSDEAMRDVGIAVETDLTVRVYREHYIEIKQSTAYKDYPPGWYPDALVPHRSRAFNADIAPRTSQLYWVDVTGAAAGDYTVEVLMTVGGVVRERAAIPVRIYDFSVPEKHGFKTSLHRYSFRPADNKALAKYSGLDVQSAEFAAVRDNVAAVMAEHLAYPSLMIDAADGQTAAAVYSKAFPKSLEKKYKDATERFSCNVFNFPAYYSSSPESSKCINYLKNCNTFVARNPWAQGASIYFDEPNTEDYYKKIVAFGEAMQKHAPMLRLQVTEQIKSSFPPLILPVDIWIPQFGLMDMGLVRERIMAGDQVWSYTCLVQGSQENYGAMHWHIESPYIYYLMPMWAGYANELSGVLYWSSTAWRGDPWDGSDYQAGGKPYNGEGYLLYPGDAIGLPGEAVPSVRLKQIREGLDDYRLFVMLGDRVLVLGAFSQNEEDYSRVRGMIYEALNGQDKNSIWRGR